MAYATHVFLYLLYTYCTNVWNEILSYTCVYFYYKYAYSEGRLAMGLRVVHLGRSTSHATSGRGD